MIVSRPALARGLAAVRLARPVPSSVLRRNLQPVLRRGYAEGGGHAAPSSDLPWLAGAIAVTVPSCYFLWPEASHGEAHHGHEDGEEHEEQEEHEDGQEGKSEEGGDGQEESQDAAPADDGDDASADKSDESADAGESEESGKSEDSGDSDESVKSDDSEAKKSDGDAKASKGEPVKTSNQKVDGVQFKGKTSAGDDNNEITDTRKREPDGKGGFKKRIDSAYQKDLGQGDQKNEDGGSSGSTSSGPSGNAGAIDSKQKGLSTTPTRHSTQIDQDPDKSKKGEGTPETAKSMTPVDPSRPAR